MVEIERKFLVASGAFKRDAFTSYKITQGFLNTHPDRTVRVRIKGNRGFLTVKGRSNKEGTIRKEWETEISETDAQDLLKMCEEIVVEKTRYEVKIGRHIFEVDEFHGANEGLIIAEVELTSEDEFFSKPNWLGKEVTGVLKYYNSQLSIQPYTHWEL